MADNLRVHDAQAATATKTWSFDTDTEGLTDAGSHANIIFSRNATDTAVLFSTTNKNLSGATEYARRSATGETWESWGIPAGSTVTNVQITAWQKKLVINTKLTSHAIKFRIIDSSGASVHGAGDLINTSLPTTTNASYQSQPAGTILAIDAGSQASNTDVRFEMEYAVTTGGGGGSANVDQRFDTITLIITYDLPPAGPNASDFGNNTEGALADGGRSGQQITVTGSDFGSGPSDGTNNAVKIGTYIVPNGNVSVWNPTTITFTIPAAATVYGGTGTNGLIIRSGGVDDTTPLAFYIYPNITSTPANNGQIGSTIAVSGDHFGTTAGTVTVNTKSATVVGAWSETTLTVRIPGQEGLANINGKIQLTRSDSRTSNQYPAGNFTILAPSVSGSNPALAATGQTLAIEFSGLGIDTDTGTAPVLTLAKSGQTDITGTSYAKVTDYQTVSATFDLSGAATGWWNLSITNMDQQSGSYGDESTFGFYVSPLAPTVTAIDPEFGLNSGTANIASITGTNFQAGATVKLTKSGEADITPSTAFTFTNATTLSSGAFDLSGKATGFWNVIVTNPDLQTGAYTGGFEIRSSKPSLPANIYQFKTDTDPAQPPTANIATGDGIGGQTTIYFRMDMAGGLTGENYYPQVEVQPIGSAFECTNASPSPCTVTGGFFAEGARVTYNGTAVQGWVSINGIDGTSYHWQTRVRNSAGVSDWVAFGGNSDPNDTDVYIDNTSPTITIGTDGTCATASANISDLGAMIQWNTSDATSGALNPPGTGSYATAQVQYIKTNQFADWVTTPGSLSPLSARENSPHHVSLSSLAPGTTYTFRMRSKDAVNNETLSVDCTLTTSSSRPLKTVEFFIDQETSQNTGTRISKDFSIYIPESPGGDVSVKSAFIEISGITDAAAGQTINVELRRGLAQTFVASGADYTVDSTGTSTPFTILFDALNPPGSGQESMADIASGATTYNYTLFLNGTAVPISTFSAKLIITYSYVI